MASCCDNLENYRVPRDSASDAVADELTRENKPSRESEEGPASNNEGPLSLEATLVSSVCSSIKITCASQIGALACSFG